MFFYQIRLNIQVLIVLRVCFNCYHKKIMHLVLKIEKEHDVDEHVKMLMSMLRK